MIVAPRGISFLAVAAFLLHCSAKQESTDLSSSAVAAGRHEPRFLVAEGVGSEAEARAYYAALGREFVPGSYTLTRWLADNIGSRPVNQGFYKNSHELGFWREMRCTAYVGRGIGGCAVTNWKDPSDKGAGKPNRGTVTMNVSVDGRTQFFVFAPNGTLSPSALLDDEGEKFVPRVCIACHTGQWDGPSSGTDLHAIFREFEPSQLEALPGRSGETEWFDLNQSVRSANTALSTEAEGAAFGLDHARAAQNAYVPSIYRSTSPPVSRPVDDLAHLPPSWNALGDTPTLLAAKKKLWTRVLAPYCMTCHRTNAADWADYAQFEFLGSTSKGVSYLELYTAPIKRHRAGIPFMPQAELLFNQLQADAEVKPAIDGWVSALGAPPCEVGTSCTPKTACYEGAITECSETKTTCSATVPVADGTPCGEDLACSQGECLPSIVVTVPRINPGVYVRNERPLAAQAHVHVDVNGTLLVADLDTVNMCVLAQTEVTMRCNLSTLVCTDPRNGDEWKVVAGNTLQRTSGDHPDRNGIYRRESPIDVAPCP